MLDVGYGKNRKINTIIEFKKVSKYLVHTLYFETLFKYKSRPLIIYYCSETCYVEIAGIVQKRKKYIQIICKIIAHFSVFFTRINGFLLCSWQIIIKRALLK